MAVLLSQYHAIVAMDIVSVKVEGLNTHQSPIDDADIAYFLAQKPLNFRATLDKPAAYTGASSVVIATPTHYDVDTNYFNTSAIYAGIMSVLTHKPAALMLIKSTVPVGFTVQMRAKYGTANLIFSPEFLREGKALYDNLYPSRIVVGQRSARAQGFADLLLQGAIKKTRRGC